MNTRKPFTDQVALRRRYRYRFRTDSGLISNRSSPRKAPRPGVVLPTFIVIAIALASCTHGPAGNAKARSPSPGTPSANPAATPLPISATTPIVIELDGRRVAAKLNDSATSVSLLAQLPLTLSFRDHGGQEKISELPAPLDLEGSPGGSDAAPLTLGYYVPQQSLVLYYHHVGYFAGITATIRKAD